MSQVVMNELVNMSQEIIKLKDEKRELIAAAKKALIYLAYSGQFSRSSAKGVLTDAIAKAEATK
jgi:catabolite regulation protein CreA